MHTSHLYQPSLEAFETLGILQAGLFPLTEAFIATLSECAGAISRSLLK